MNTNCKKTDYHEQASYFARLPEFNIECGTDFLAIKDAPKIISAMQPLKKILDLGCGTGLATRYLKKHFPEATIMGADINQSMLEQAKVADPEGIYVHLIESENSVHYSFLPETFDVVVCSFVFHENQSIHDFEDFLYNISRLLRPNGLLLAWDTHQNLFQGKWVSIETLSPQGEKINDGEQFTVKLLPAGATVSGCYWSPETITNLAKNQNFKNIEIHYPVMEKEVKGDWLDETRLAPYYLMEAYKGF